MWWKILITALSIVGTIWFGRLSYIAANNKDFFCYPFAAIMIVCMLVAIGFGIWLIFS